MLSYATAAALLLVGLVLGAVLPGVGGVIAGTTLSFLAAALVVVLLRRRADLAVLCLVAGIAALPAAGGPLVARDLVLRAVGSEETCAVRSVEVLRTGRSGRGVTYRFTVACPSGPLTFDASPTAMERSRPTVGVLVDPTGLVSPRPVDLLLPAWSAAIPAAAYVALTAVVVIARRREPVPS